MPCYDGRDEIERKYQDAQAEKVEAVLCGVVTVFGLKRVMENIDLTECGVGKYWIKDWWQQHQRNDEIPQEDRGGQRHTRPAQND